MSDVHTQRANPQQGASKGAVQQEKLSSAVTYLPTDGDPIKVVWNGIEFRANVPVDLPHGKTILVPMRKEYNTPEGDLRAKSVETRISMVELARGNPSFSVDGVQAERKIGTARLPTDNDQYRGYAMHWIRDATTLSALNMRWDSEAALRERCGCDDKDVNWLRPFLEARRDEVKQAA
jgi:hypothetical protein